MDGFWVYVEEATDDCDGCGCVLGVLGLLVFILIILMWIGILGLTFKLAEWFDGGIVAYCISCAILFFAFSFILSLIVLGRSFSASSIFITSIIITILSYILTLLTILIWHDNLSDYPEYVEMLSNSRGSIPSIITVFVASTIGSSLGYKIRHRN